jgi:hypothetical protein
VPFAVLSPSSRRCGEEIGIKKMVLVSLLEVGEGEQTEVDTGASRPVRSLGERRWSVLCNVPQKIMKSKKN